jgi:hypothetical protein
LLAINESNVGLNFNKSVADLCKVFKYFTKFGLVSEDILNAENILFEYAILNGKCMPYSNSSTLNMVISSVFGLNQVETNQDLVERAIDAINEIKLTDSNRKIISNIFDIAIASNSKIDAGLIRRKLNEIL